MKFTETNCIIGSILFAFIIGILSLCGSFYNASVQADVYKRNGANITTWEVWCGAKPLERVINNNQKALK